MRYQSKIKLNYRKISMGVVVQDVRTVFEKQNGTTTHIPIYYYCKERTKKVS